MRIPKQLQNPKYRFYLIARNEKLPLEKLWNTKNNYPFFHERLLRHRGNYGIVTGINQLIVLDFDSREFYESVADRLPTTFTITSARKKLPHMYYHLEGEMFKKVGIDMLFDKENGQYVTDQPSIDRVWKKVHMPAYNRFYELKRVLDIQGDRNGIVAPGSSIDRSYYMVINDKPIVKIDITLLMAIFNFNPMKRREYTGDATPQPEKVSKTIMALETLGIRQTKPRMYQCPFHPMTGTGNLSVMDSGRLYCFHEQKCWHDAEQFINEVMQYRNH